MTRISGCPGTLRLGSTMTRPARSSWAPARSARTLPRREARTPAAQSTVWVAMRSVRPSTVKVAPSASMAVTLALVRERTPRAINWRSALAERSGGKAGKTRGSPSIRRMAASRGSMWRKSWRSVSLAISPSAPASSTPVGPAPTMTKFSQARRSAGSPSRSARSKGRNEVCQYVGPAPVSIQQYQKVVRAQAAHVRLSRESLRQAFDDLVLPDGLLDQLGPSLIGHQSLFLYGATGNGKTSIAERILRIYHDAIVVPYAVEVDGHIISLFRSDRSPVPVPLRGHGKRQDQHRRAHPAHLSRRHCGALRGGSGRPHHHTIRPRGP